MTWMPAALADCSTLMPVCGSAGSIRRTLTPSEIIDWAIETNLALSPCAFWMSALMPASVNAFFSSGASYWVYRADEVVSGRITPTWVALDEPPLEPPDEAFFLVGLQPATA